MSNHDVNLQPQPSIDLRQANVVIFYLFIIFQAVLVYLFAEKGLPLVVIALLSVTLLIFLAMSVERMYYLFALYVALAPAPTYLRHFPGMPIFYAMRFAVPLFGLVLFLWMIYLLRHHEDIDHDLGTLDRAVAIYLGLAVVSALIGFLRGFSFPYILNDLLPHLYWLGYFIFRYSPLNKNIKRFFDIILFMVIIVSLEFVYGFSQSEVFVFFRRIVARSIHLMPFAIAYIGATIVYDRTRARRILFACLLPVVLFAVVVCQQRSLWFSSLLMLLVLLAIYLYSRRQSILKNSKRVLALSAVSIAVILLFGLNIIKTPLGMLLHSRLLIFLDPRLISFDVSWWTRGAEIAQALAHFERQFMFGSGFGATIVSPLRYFILFAPDNAYVYLLWKMGIAGFAAFLVIHALFIRRCLFVLRRALKPDDKIFALTGMLNILALMITGFANACVSQYEFLIIWTAIMAAIEMTARRYE